MFRFSSITKFSVPTVCYNYKNDSVHFVILIGSYRETRATTRVNNFLFIIANKSHRNNIFYTSQRGANIFEVSNFILKSIKFYK